jgi:hypothetical protein
MSELELTARLQKAIRQRNEAQDEVILLTGQLAMAGLEIGKLNEQIEKAKVKQCPPENVGEEDSGGQGSATTGIDPPQTGPGRGL